MWQSLTISHDGSSERSAWFLESIVVRCGAEDNYKVETWPEVLFEYHGWLDKSKGTSSVALTPSTRRLIYYEVVVCTNPRNPLSFYVAYIRQRVRGITSSPHRPFMPRCRYERLRFG